MAQYAERVYAVDSWQETRKKGGSAEVSRAARLQSSVGHSFAYDGYPWCIETDRSAEIKLLFPLSEQYGKKRLVSAAASVWVSGRSFSASGTVRSGRLFFGVDGKTDNSTFYADETFSPPLELSELSPNSYHLVGEYTSDLTGELSEAARTGAFTVCPSVWAGNTGDLITANHYTVSASMQIHGHTGENVPYADYVYEDVIPSAEGCTPRSGFVDDREKIRFSWRFSYNRSAVAHTLIQKAYGFRWRVKGESDWNEETVSGTVSAHTAEAGTFPENGSVQWCVRVQSDDGIWSEWSDVYELTTQDSLSSARRLSPDKVYVDGNGQMRFSWIHTVATGTQQTAFEAVYSVDGGASWQAMANGIGAENSFILAAGTVPSGEMSWKVRTANSDGVFGDYSEAASVIVRAVPSAPVLSGCDPAPAVKLWWQATEQQGYEIKIDGKRVDQRYGTEKSWQSPDLLADGEHEAAVRVCNRYGLWSDWTACLFSVCNTPKGRINPEIRAAGYTIQLRWEIRGEYTAFAVLRDGECIGKTQENSFTDQESCGKNRYRVIGLHEDGHYTESREVIGFLRIEKAAIGCGGVWIPTDLGVNEPPLHEKEAQARISYTSYYGEELPSAEREPGVLIRHRLVFAVKTKEQAEQIERFLGCRVIWKSPSGDSFAGILDSVEKTEAAAWRVCLLITEAKEWADE